MAQVEYSTTSYRTPLHHRITASMPVRASWVDSETGETVNVEGLTENVGETSALVNLDTLPPVGSQVRLKILEEGKQIIEEKKEDDNHIFEKVEIEASFTGGEGAWKKFLESVGHA